MKKYKEFIDSQFDEEGKIIRKPDSLFKKMQYGILAFTMICVIFKILGIIDWSWWWVLCPLWILLGILCISLMLLSITWFIVWITYKIKINRTKKFIKKKINELKKNIDKNGTT